MSQYSATRAIGHDWSHDRGKFAGVTGSGTMNSVVNATTFEVSQVWDGLAAMPPKQ